MSRRIKVIEINSKEVLFECDVDDEDKAYAYAKDMEDMGIEVEINSPSLPETLVSTLGANQEDIEALKKMMNEEIESHSETTCNPCIPDVANQKLH